MEATRSRLLPFYAAIRGDHRIGPIHISLYLAIFQLYELGGCVQPVRTGRAALMSLAKIGGLPTFHKYITELDAFGYILYVRSYDHSVESQFFLLKVNVIDCVTDKCVRDGKEV